LTVTDALGAEAAPATFVHAGETFAVSPVTQQLKSAVEQALRATAYGDLYELRGRIPEDQYADALKAIQRDRRSYAYLGPVFWETLATDGGALMMVRLIFGTTEAKARKLIEQRGPDVQALVQEQILSSMPPALQQAARQQMEQRQPDPEGGAPANPPTPA
jgi:hypothetical protein